jgi:FtsP/CotA-like multicopper oxidase with cupredoxin domain
MTAATHVEYDLRGLDVSNPGLRTAQCHLAEHTASGMMFSFTVARTPEPIR